MDSINALYTLQLQLVSVRQCFVGVMSQRGRSLGGTAKWTPSQKVAVAMGVVALAVLSVVTMVAMMPPPATTPPAAIKVAKATMPVIDQ